MTGGLRDLNQAAPASQSTPGPRDVSQEHQKMSEHSSNEHQSKDALEASNSQFAKDRLSRESSHNSQSKHFASNSQDKTESYNESTPTHNENMPLQPQHHESQFKQQQHQQLNPMHMQMPMPMPGQFSSQSMMQNTPATATTGQYAMSHQQHQGSHLQGAQNQNNTGGSQSHLASGPNASAGGNPASGSASNFDSYKLAQLQQVAGSSQQRQQPQHQHYGGMPTPTSASQSYAPPMQQQQQSMGSSAPPVCRLFQSGHCHYGAACRYVHSSIQQQQHQHQQQSSMMHNAASFGEQSDRQSYNAPNSESKSQESNQVDHQKSTGMNSLAHASASTLADSPDASQHLSAAAKPFQVASQQQQQQTHSQPNEASTCHRFATINNEYKSSHFTGAGGQQGLDVASSSSIAPLLSDDLTDDVASEGAHSKSTFATGGTMTGLSNQRVQYSNPLSSGSSAPTHPPMTSQMQSQHQAGAAAYGNAYSQSGHQQQQQQQHQPQQQQQYSHLLQGGQQGSQPYGSQYSNANSSYPPSMPHYDHAACASGGPSAFVARPSAQSLHGHSFAGINADPELAAQLFSPSNHTLAGIDFSKYDEVDVEVTGVDAAPPVSHFDELAIPDVLRSNIQLAGYNTPTPIQKYAVPIALWGRDIMACSQTGSGKTAAFLFPLTAHLINNGFGQGGHHSAVGMGRMRKFAPFGLILAPSRELATQINEEAVKFCYQTTLHPVCVYGGCDVRQQLRELERGCEIIVATPGRLNDMIERGRITLQCINYLVMDECDRMLDMGFEPQIRAIVQGADMSLTRQTLLFSATLPKEIQRLAADFLYNYIFIAVGKVGSSSESITQHCIWVEESSKPQRLVETLQQCTGLTLVFVERKKSADQLENWLCRQGVSASSIHGDRSQQEREYALSAFRSGRIQVLCATDVAARGLDIPNVTDVINYDMSNSIEDYVHRIGRTGRCGNHGVSTSFFNDKNSNTFKDLYNMLQENKQQVPDWLTQQMMAIKHHHQGPRSQGRNRQGHSNTGARDFRSKEQFGGGGGGAGGFNAAPMNAFGSHAQNQRMPAMHRSGGQAQHGAAPMGMGMFAPNSASASASAMNSSQGKGFGFGAPQQVSENYPAQLQQQFSAPNAYQQRQ